MIDTAINSSRLLQEACTLDKQPASVAAHAVHRNPVHCQEVQFQEVLQHEPQMAQCDFCEVFSNGTTTLTINASSSGAWQDAHLQRALPERLMPFAMPGQQSGPWSPGVRSGSLQPRMRLGGGSWDEIPGRSCPDMPEPAGQRRNYPDKATGQVRILYDGAIVPYNDTMQVAACALTLLTWSAFLCLIPVFDVHRQRHETRCSSASQEHWNTSQIDGWIVKCTIDNLTCAVGPVTMLRAHMGVSCCLAVNCFAWLQDGMHSQD